MSLEQTPLRPAGGDIAYLTANQVRARYGGVSDMTLFRWLGSANLQFPRPMIVNRRRFWRLDEIEQWESTRPVKTTNA